MRLKRVLAFAAPLALAAMLAGAPGQAQDLKIATSMPGLGFPFFVHMQNQLNAEAEKLGGIEVINYDGENSTPKQTADVEAAVVSGVDGLVISPSDAVAMAPARAARRWRRGCPSSPSTGGSRAWRCSGTWARTTSRAARRRRT